MSDKKKKGFDFSGGYRANQDGIGSSGTVEYVYKNGKVIAVPYVRGSASKSFKKGKPHTAVDRMGVDAEYKPTKNSFIRAAASTDPKGKNKKGRIEAGFTFKEGGMVKKCRMDGIALRGKTKAKERSK